jgi:hypothetical protein
MPRLRLWFAAVLLAASAVILGWGVAPAPYESHVLLIGPEGMELPSRVQQGPAGTNAPGTPNPGAAVETATPVSSVRENRRLLLEFPTRIRRGDSEIASLILDLNTDGSGTSHVAAGNGHLSGENTQGLDVYQTHNVIAEAHLDMAGIDVRPSETVSEPLLPGESAVFRWRMHPTEPGNYVGTSWLFLEFVHKSTQTRSRVALSAQTVKIEATSLFGLGGNVARWVGGLGLIAAGLVGFPYADDLLKWFRARASAVP